MNLNYRNDRDIELWVINGGGWFIPVRCRHCEADGVEHFHITPAVPLGFAQTSAVSRLLGLHESVELNTGWLISQTNFARIASKATGITPEFYYSWDGTKKPAESTQQDVTVTARKRPAETADEFLQHVASGSGLNLATLSMAWLAITQAMPAWLLSGKPLNLGFSRIVALPYRRNWKELLMARCPTLKKSLMVSGARRLLLAFTAASRMIRLSELTECRERQKRSMFTWTLEVIHDSSWEKTCEEVEGEAAARLGPIAYVKRWANRVSQLEERIYEVLAAHVAKETAPTCRVYWRRGERGMRFVQASPSVLGPVEVLECDDGGGQSVDDFLGIEDSAAYLEEKASRLLQVPAVPLEGQDVRPPRGDDQQDQPDPRVLVLHATGGEASDQGVLAGGDGSAGQMDQ